MKDIYFCFYCRGSCYLCRRSCFYFARKKFYCGYSYTSVKVLESPGIASKVVMGSPLALVLANIFMGFHESEWLNEYNLNKT